MRLKSLEMGGFKSFVDRTIVHFEEGITGVVGPNGCGKCVHGDTRVQLADGSIRSIRSLVESAFEGADSIERMEDGQYTYDNPEGVSVLSLDTRDLKIKHRPVLGFVRRTSPEKLLNITTRSGRDIIATEYHPLFIQDGDRVRAVRADELKEGAFIAAPRKLPVNASLTHFTAISESGDSSELIAVDNMLMTKGTRTKPLSVVTRLSPEWGRFLGYIISEGQNSIWSDQVRFVNADTAVLSDFSDTVESLFDRKPVRKKYKPGSEDCFLFSSTLCDLLERTFGMKRGGHSSEKKVPSILFEAEDDVVWEFLSALIEGDGHICSKNSKSGKHEAYMEYATASEELARGFASLLLRMGVQPLLRSKEKRATNSSGLKRVYYSVYAYGLENLQILRRGLKLVSAKAHKLESACSERCESKALDTIPNFSEQFARLWKDSHASIKKNHPLRGRIEAYRTNRCNASRNGLSEAIAYMRESAKTWNDETEAAAAYLERLTTSNVYWDEIVSVKEIPGEEWVYDLCVEETHNFVANDLFVHNSNIVDAIRWVMGEMSAKHLRGSEMQDVIFNGAETRQPTGMAQVFLTFDNADGRAPAEYSQYNEIQVGRRLYRSGESEYFINKTPCRLRDIIDLFLGTGVGTKAYSVVEQGMIGNIVSSKPEDRRLLIEEAAGISKFKSRKEAALRKMEATRGNLVRLSDVLSELTRQMNSLHRQVKKAERYQQYSGELKDRELAVAATRYQSLRLELEELETDNAKLIEKEVASASELAIHEANVEERKVALATIDRDLDGVQQQLYSTQNTIKLTEADIQYKLREIASIREHNDNAQRELGEMQARIGGFDEKVSAMNEQKVTADLALSSSREVLEELKRFVVSLEAKRDAAEEELEEAQTRISEANFSIQQQASKLEHFEQRKQDLSSREARDNARLQEIEAKGVKVKADVEQKQAELNRMQAEKKAFEERGASMRNALEEARGQLAEGEEKFQELKGHLQDRSSRFNSLVELQKNLEGYRDGVRAVLKKSKEGGAFAGVLGTIGDLIEVTEPKYERAVSALLGDRLQFLVVKSQQEGVIAVDYLKTNASGRSSFVPLDLLSSAPEEVSAQGERVLARMSDVVRMSDDYRGIAQYLFKNVLLVKDLQQALHLSGQEKNNAIYVTLSGEVVDLFGIITGGEAGDASERLIAQKRKIKELETEIDLLRQEVAAASAEVASLREKAIMLEGELESITRELHEQELKRFGLERDLQNFEAEKGRLTEEWKRISEEKKRLESEAAQLGEGEVKAHETMQSSQREKDAVEEELEALEQRLDEANETLSEKEEELVAQKVSFGQAEERQGAIEREIEVLITTKTETEMGIQRRKGEIKKGEGDIDQHQCDIEELKKRLNLSITATQKLDESQKQLKDKYEAAKAQLQQYEVSIREIRKTHNEALQASHEVELRLTEHRGRMTYLVDGIRERYHLDLAEVEEERSRLDDETFDLEAESITVEELKEKIEKIGSVNVDALQEYEELQERSNFLGKQHTDLTASLDALEKAIAKINRTSRKRFAETFSAVNEQFQQLFPKLFRGGQARLMLTNKDDLLETGVDIIAQPPGKRLQSITLLSGGEKALTAVALIFSIFLIKPSPFCLLDEVDAPLDDANIDRFNDLIRGMTPHSQFILITHNKRTMELADTLYGVTMEEAGVSKMVSVRLQEDATEPETPETAVA